MEYTVKISSSATNESARYVDILQRTFEIIMEDSILNGYELAGISDETCSTAKILGTTI